MTVAAFIRAANTPWRIWLMLFWKLPAAWFMGVRVHRMEEHQCAVRLPYSWRAQNPFRSTYFAAQCAAGEFSTGLPALAHVQAQARPVSMLVTDIEASFYKKVSETLIFTCTDTPAIQAAIEKALSSGEAQTFQATSTARLPDGTVATVVRITWSFKVKS